MRVLVTAFLFATLALAFRPEGAQAQDPGWSRYENARFGFGVDYPAGLLPEIMKSENGDGQQASSPDDMSWMAMWGANNALETTVREIFANAKASDTAPDYAYARVTDRWFVLSWIENRDGRAERIHYQKMVASPDNSQFAGFEIAYPVSERALYDPLLKRIADSLSPPASADGG